MACIRHETPGEIQLRVLLPVYVDHVSVAYSESPILLPLNPSTMILFLTVQRVVTDNLTTTRADNAGQTVMIGDIINNDSLLTVIHHYCTVHIPTNGEAVLPHTCPQTLR